MDKSKWTYKPFAECNAIGGIQLVSVTHDFKYQAPDGKQRAADALDAECVQTVAKNYPNNRAREHQGLVHL